MMIPRKNMGAFTRSFTEYFVFLVSCVPACQNNGICNEGRCYCPQGYRGITCEIRKYPKIYNVYQNAR